MRKKLHFLPDGSDKSLCGISAKDWDHKTENYNRPVCKKCQNKSDKMFNSYVNDLIRQTQYCGG